MRLGLVVAAEPGSSRKRAWSIEQVLGQRGETDQRHDHGEEPRQGGLPARRALRREQQERDAAEQDRDRRVRLDRDTGDKPAKQLVAGRPPGQGGRAHENRRRSAHEHEDSHASEGRLVRWSG
jgi:hypothetical protein